MTTLLVHPGRRWVAPLAVATACFAAPVAAQIDINVNAEHGVAWSDGQIFAPPVTRAWGWAQAEQATGGHIGSFGTGPAPCDAIVCPPGPSVGGVAGAIARADASRMNVGVRAWGAGGLAQPRGDAEVSVTDTLLWPSLTTLDFDVHLDLSAFSVSAQPGSEGSYQFVIQLGAGDFVTTAFAFSATRRHVSQDMFETTLTVFDGSSVFESDTIPSSWDSSLQVTLPPGGQRIQITARAFAAGPIHALSFVNVNAYNSAWLGIEGSFDSSNGYAYPGFAPVPEPGAWALMLSGLLLVAGRLAAAGRDRRRAASRG